MTAERKPSGVLAKPLARMLTPEKRYHVHGVGLCAVDYLCRVDHLPSLGEKLQVEAIARRAGGQVGTALAALARWGLRTVYSGKFGDDADGRFGQEELTAAGVDLRGAVVAPAASSQSSFIMVDALSGERTIVWQRSAEAVLQPSELHPRLTEQSLALLIDGHEIDAAIEAARVARRCGAIVMLDAEEVAASRHVDELVGLCDIVIGCAEFPRLFTQLDDPHAALRQLHTRLPPGGLAGCTLGPSGAMLFDGERRLASSGFPVDALDTTGAGDIFHAAFLYAVLMMPERGLQFRLDFSNACAALSCLALGAREGIPRLQDALRLASERETARKG